ncbi:hypothetical protein [Niabella soli]|uniref:Outer membrane protein beta-barrel domain-containing protein n=1 Tax=Niabella soli DSM 19437 TaxID=929713 RepID=W0F5I0_9BACT|nr:hypothetical protein [Niabella soli]AHF17078.1 hypothetical protein NIASO_01365 [Niabella soli DSM 19437]
MSYPKTLLSLLSLLFVLNSYGQVRWFIRPEGNFSLVRKTNNTGSYPITINDMTTLATITARSHFDHQSGAGLSGGFTLPLAVKKLSLEVTAGMVLTGYRAHTALSSIYNGGGMPTLGGWPISGSTYLEFYGYAGGFTDRVPDPGNSHPISAETTEKNFKQGKVNHVYAQLNLGAKYNLLRKTAIGLSAVPYLLAKSTTHTYKEGAAQPGGTILLLQTKSSAKDDYQTIGLAGQAKVEQTLNARFALQASFTHHFSNIYKEQPNDVPGRKPKMQYVSLGLTYYVN